MIDDEQMRKGFESIVAELEELVLDVPHVVDLFSFFVCRAISDDILPPCFVKEAPCTCWFFKCHGSVNVYLYGVRARTSMRVVICLMYL